MKYPGKLFYPFLVKYLRVSKRTFIFVLSITQKKKTMTKSAANRITNKANKMESEKGYSLGFCRIHALPKAFRVKMTFAIAFELGLCAVKNGAEVESKIKSFLSGMNDNEFANWIIINK